MQLSLCALLDHSLWESVTVPWPLQQLYGKVQGERNWGPRWPRAPSQTGPLPRKPSPDAVPALVFTATSRETPPPLRTTQPSHFRAPELQQWHERNVYSCKKQTSKNKIQRAVSHALQLCSRALMGEGLCAGGYWLVWFPDSSPTETTAALAFIWLPYWGFTKDFFMGKESAAQDKLGNTGLQKHWIRWPLTLNDVSHEKILLTNTRAAFTSRLTLPARKHNP